MADGVGMGLIMPSTGASPCVKHQVAEAVRRRLDNDGRWAAEVMGRLRRWVATGGSLSPDPYPGGRIAAGPLPPALCQRLLLAVSFSRGDRTWENGRVTAHLAALVLTTNRIVETLTFYRTIGLPLSEEDHGDGLVHWACDVGGIHFAVFDADGDGEAPGYREPGSTFCGFVVNDVDAVLADLRALGSVVLQAPNSMPWGVRAVVKDPDGRPVEIFVPVSDE
jgi:lactoylglutathione lyase